MTVEQASSTFSVLILLLGLAAVICLLSPSFVFLSAVFISSSLISFPRFLPAVFSPLQFFKEVSLSVP